MRKIIPQGRGFVFNAQPLAVNATDALTGEELVWSGVITSTSAAAVTITTPSAADALAAIEGGGVGSVFDLIIDNSQGRSTVTLALHSSFSVVSPAITGGDTLTVTIYNKVAMFRFYFTSATTANVFRIF